MFRKTILADVVQGIIVGGLLAFFTANQINRIIGFFTLLPERTIFGGIVQGIIVGGVLVYSGSDLPTAYGLAKQITLAPFGSK